MNKNLVAIAIAAALAVPTMASAEVKIIGQAQLELVNTSGDAVTEGLTLGDGSQSGSINRSNASAIGVTGSHDLGNGMMGLYKVNFNFHPDDDDSGTIGDRDQFVGVKGDFGTVLAGRINTPYKTSTVKWDPFLATFMQARGQNAMSGLHNGYADNVIAYANNFGGIKFVGAVAIDESDDDATPTNNEFDADHALTASVNIPVGDSIEIAVAFIDFGAAQDANGDGSEDTLAAKIGVKWTAGDFTVAGQVESLDEDLGDTTNAFVTASMAMGADSVALSLGSSTDESTGGQNDGTYAALGYKKSFSKKVSGHVGVVVIDEGTATINQDITQVGAGLRVKF